MSLSAPAASYTTAELCQALKRAEDTIRMIRVMLCCQSPPLTLTCSATDFIDEVVKPGVQPPFDWECPPPKVAKKRKTKAKKAAARKAKKKAKKK